MFLHTLPPRLQRERDRLDFRHKRRDLHFSPPDLGFVAIDFDSVVGNGEKVK